MYSRCVYSEGVSGKPFCTYSTLQLHLSQLSTILFIHRAHLGIHGFGSIASTFLEARGKKTIKQVG